MMTQEKTPELFRLVYYESEFTRDPLDITVMTQISLPDGIVLDEVVHENLERFISTRFPAEDLAQLVAKNISCKLVESLRQALELKLAKSIDEKLKHYGERTIFQMPGMRQEGP